MLDQSNAYAMPGTAFFDMAPAAGGEPYRIFLSIPKTAPPEKGWPLLVLTDGNATFPFAVACHASQAPYPTATNTGYGVIVAIGYPTDEAYDGYRRSWDLVAPPGGSYPPYVEGGAPVLTGGADRFLEFLERELLPKIEEAVSIDAERRALFGHSFGGLFTLFSLFERPDLFANWIAASPAIYWEDHAILNWETPRKPATRGQPYLHLSAGEYEGDELAPFQRLNDDAGRRLEKKKLERTVGLAEEMAQRLDGSTDGLRTEFELYRGETHMSVLASAINRAVGIAFAVRR